MKPNWRTILLRCIEDAVPHAVRRVYKHRERYPSVEEIAALQAAMADEFLLTANEWFTFTDAEPSA